MKIQLGMIVTNMAGSVAGQTVRRYRGGFIMSNKNSYSANSRNNMNNRIAATSFYFREWRNIAQEVRELWNSQAPNFQYVDKFGNSKTLTGRQLYTSLNINIAYIGGAAPNPATLDNQVALIDWEPVSVSVSDDEYPLTMFVNDGSVRYVLRVARLRNVTDVVSVRRTSYLTGGSLNAETTVDLKPLLVAKYGILSELDCFMITLTTYSPSGFRGVILSQNFILQ